MARPKGSKNKPRTPPSSVAEVRDISGTSPEDVDNLKKQIADLEKQLKVESSARSDAEEKLLAQAQAQTYVMGIPVDEVPTGKTVTIRVLDHYETVSYKDDGRPILKPKFKTEKVPTFFYRIDMPPVGGMHLSINGQPFYHGTTYEFDVHTLRSVKDIVYRCWKHDKDIHGSDENFYRKKQAPVLSARGAH